MNWTKKKLNWNRKGEYTIQYTSDTKPVYVIESIRRAIPHANGSGEWLHTTYWVHYPDNQRIQYNLFNLAKRACQTDYQRRRGL